MLLEWIALCSVPQISIALKRELIDYFETPKKVFEASSGDLQDSRILSSSAIEKIRGCDWREAESRLRTLTENAAGFVSYKDNCFPTLLNQIQSPPLGLFFKGDITLADSIQLAIVGSRNASPNGIRIAAAFAKALGQAGLTITSGMATGIDSAAHQSALETDSTTIAVMGAGIDLIYPKSNSDLYHRISHQGLVLSEFLPGTTPRRSHFPQRNRIISGLSLGTLVVEAGSRSGSLITARLSAEQGREVFAIPGSIHMPTSRGCHQLIRDGAKLVESIDDIMEELAIEFTESANIQFGSGGSERECDNLLYKLIDFTPTPLDVLIQDSGLDTEIVLGMLLKMELDGVIVKLPSGYVKHSVG